MKTLWIVLALAFAGCQATPDAPTRTQNLEWDRVRAQLALRNAQRHVEARNLGSARRELEGAIGSGSATADVHVMLARVAIEAGHWHAVEPNLAAAERLEPDHASVHAVRGLLAEAQGRWTAAAQSYAIASKRLPTNERIQVARMRALEAAGHDVNVNRHVADPAAGHSSTGVLLIAGNRELNAGRADSALRYYDAALRKQPGSRPAWNGRAMALYALGRHGEVVAALRDRVGDTDASRLQLTLARSALVTESYPIAVRMLQAHVERRRDDADAWLDLARAFFLMDRPQQTEQALRETLALQPRNATAAMLWGHMRFRSGQFNEAALAYERASKLGAGDHRTLAALIDASRRRFALQVRSEQPRAAVAQRMVNSAQPTNQGGDG